jgi:hypothetical protein
LGEVSARTGARGEADEASILARVLRLRPTRYTYRSEYRNLGLPEGTQYGLIAQELEQVFPELVSTHSHELFADPAGDSSDGEENGAEEVVEVVEYKGINYQALIPLLIQAVQEQQREIQALQAEVERLVKESERR